MSYDIILATYAFGGLEGKWIMCLNTLELPATRAHYRGYRRAPRHCRTLSTAVTLPTAGFANILVRGCNMPKDRTPDPKAGFPRQRMAGSGSSALHILKKIRRELNDFF